MNAGAAYRQQTETDGDAPETVEPVSMLTAMQLDIIRVLRCKMASSLCEGVVFNLGNVVPLHGSETRKDCSDHQRVPNTITDTLLV